MAGGCIAVVIRISLILFEAKADAVERVGKPARSPRRRLYEPEASRSVAEPAGKPRKRSMKPGKARM